MSHLRVAEIALFVVLTLSTLLSWVFHILPSQTRMDKANLTPDKEVEIVEGSAKDGGVREKEERPSEKNIVWLGIVENPKTSLAVGIFILGISALIFLGLHAGYGAAVIAAASIDWLKTFELVGAIILGLALLVWLWVSKPWTKVNLKFPWRLLQAALVLGVIVAAIYLGNGWWQKHEAEERREAVKKLEAIRAEKAKLLAKALFIATPGDSARCLDTNMTVHVGKEWSGAIIGPRNFRFEYAATGTGLPYAVRNGDGVVTEYWPGAKGIESPPSDLIQFMALTQKEGEVVLHLFPKFKCGKSHAPDTLLQDTSYIVPPQRVYPPRPHQNRPPIIAVDG